MSAANKINDGETVEAWLKRMPSPQSESLTELRQLIHDAAPQLEERINWSSPWYEGCGNVIYLVCQSNYATFGVCNGAHLDNPDGLLEGIGKDMRHVKVPSFEEVPKEKLRALLERAVGYDESLA